MKKNKKKPSLHLSLDNRPFAFKAFPPIAERVRDVLIGLPEGALFSSPELKGKFNISREALAYIHEHWPELTDFHLNRRIYGTAATIALFRKKRSEYEAGR